MNFDDNYIRRRSYVSRREKQRRRQRTVRIILIILILVIVLIAAAVGVFYVKNKDNPSTGSLKEEISKVLVKNNGKHMAFKLPRSLSLRVRVSLLALLAQVSYNNYFQNKKGNNKL